MNKSETYLVHSARLTNLKITCQFLLIECQHCQAIKLLGFDFACEILF